jgi:DNA-binding transcriptional ArsR family regulator
MVFGHPIRVIDDPEVVRLIGDPLRLKLLELLRQQPRTVKELAETLDVPRTRLYHHINLLEEHDLVAVDETRVVSGIIEKRYRATAYRLSIDKRLLGSGAEGQSALDAYLSLVLDEVVTEVQRAIASGLIDVDRVHEDVYAPRRLVIGRQWLRLTDEQVARFEQAFGEMMAEFDPATVFHDESIATDEGTLYEFLTGFYPVVPPEGDDAST